MRTKSNFQKRKDGSRKSWVNYKGKTIQLDFEPRKGICSDCGIRDEHTHLHHINYHDDDPLKDTIELCRFCHAKQHRKKKTYSWE
jgi:hypothetical protein